MERREVSTGTHFEEAFGYSRAVRKGPIVTVAGVAPIDDGEVVAPGDAYEQAAFSLAVVEDALAEVDAEPADVVKTRIYVADFSLWEEIGEAHRELFGDARPAVTMVGVSEFPAEEVLLEIEAEAVVDG